MDPLDPFNIGWQRGVGRVIDNGVGVGLGVSKVLFGSELGSTLAGPFGGNVPMSPAQGLENIMHTVADQILNKRVRTRAGDGTLTFTPTVLDTDVSSRDLARGQFARIQLTAERLQWDADEPGEDSADPPPTIRQVNVDRAVVDCHDIGLRTAYSPALEFGAIDVEVHVSARELRRLVRAQQPDLTLDIGTDGVIRASWSRAQRLGNVVIAAEAVEGNVHFVPEELHVSRFTVRTRNRLRTRTLTVPKLPWNLRLTAVETASRTLILKGRSDRSAGRISTITIGELPNLVRAAIRFAGRSAQPDSDAGEQHPGTPQVNSG